MAVVMRKRLEGLLVECHFEFHCAGEIGKSRQTDANAGERLASAKWLRLRVLSARPLILPRPLCQCRGPREGRITEILLTRAGSYYGLSADDRPDAGTGHLHAGHPAVPPGIPHGHAAGFDVLHLLARDRLYASHYFWTGLEVRVLLLDPARGPGFWFTTVSRSRSDGLSGFTGSIIRRVVRGEVEDGTRAALDATKRRLETAPRSSYSDRSAITGSTREARRAGR